MFAFSFHEQTVTFELGSIKTLNMEIICIMISLKLDDKRGHSIKHADYMVMAVYSLRLSHQSFYFVSPTVFPVTDLSSIHNIFLPLRSIPPSLFHRISLSLSPISPYTPLSLSNYIYKQFFFLNTQYAV